MGVFIQTACKGFAGVFSGFRETIDYPACGVPRTDADWNAVVLIGQAARCKSNISGAE
jgi:hypothetical protein